jgi:Domain of unknown function (DUF4386)
VQRQHGPTGALDGSTAADHLDDEAKTAQHLARISGFLYLIVGALGAFAGSVSTGLVIRGDPGATADNMLASAGLVRGSLAAWMLVLVADVAVGITLYVLVRRAGATLPLLAAVFRVAYAAFRR